MKSLKIQLKSYSLRLLGRKEYTVSELRKKLLAKSPKASLEEIDEVLDSLIDGKYVSDERYCEIFVRTKISAGWGKRKIQFSLSSKGVEKSLIALELSKFDDLSKEVKELVERKFGSKLAEVESYEQKQKLEAKIYRFLISRGYGFSEFKDIVQTFCNQN